MRKFLGRAGGDSVAAFPTPVAEVDRSLTVSMQKMAPGNEIETILEVFKGTAEACVWPPTQWAVRLLPLLTGEGLSAVHGLPVAARLSYLELCRALLDHLGLTEEGHRQHFREIQWEDGTQPFVVAHQIMDTAGRWLLLDERSSW